VGATRIGDIEEATSQRITTKPPGEPQGGEEYSKEKQDSR
jgi:hypothetical protein